MTDDNNDDGDDGNFDDTLSEILGTSSSVATSDDLYLVCAAVKQVLGNQIPRQHHGKIFLVYILVPKHRGTCFTTPVVET